MCEFLAGCCFSNIITLIFQLSPHDCYRVLQIQSLWQERRCAEEEGEVGQVGFDRGRYAGELDLDGDLPPIFEDGAMHLTDRGGRDRCTVKLGKQVGLPVGTEFVAEDLVHLPVGHVVGVGLDLVQDLLDFGREHVVVCVCVCVCVGLSGVRCSEEEDVPWIDMNWPNFNAAPLMRPSVETSRLIFASLINTLPPLFSPLFPAVDRRIDSDAAPHESDAASAATVVGNIPCQWLLGERAGTGAGEELTAIVEKTAESGSRYSGRTQDHRGLCQ